MKEMGEKYATFNAEKPAFYEKQSEVITAAFNDITPEADIESFVSANKTSVAPPNDIGYYSWDQDPNSGTGTALKKGKTSTTMKFAPGKSAADVLIAKVLFSNIYPQTSRNGV